VRKIQKQAQVFSKATLILCFFDVFFGIISLFYLTVAGIALVASLSTLSAVCIAGRTIQISKLIQLEKALKTLNVISIAWFTERFRRKLKKGEKAKMEINTTKISKTQWISFVVMFLGFVYGSLCALFPELSIAGEQLISMIASFGGATISGAIGTFKDYAQKSETEIAKIKEKLDAKQKLMKEEEIANAKKTIEEYENAKKILAENQNV
jgi:hypothetical protein